MIVKFVMALMVVTFGFKATMFLVLGSTLTTLMLLMLLVGVASGLINSVSECFQAIKHD